jgi:rubrerythrin
MAQSIEATRLGPNRTGQLSAPDLAEQMNDSSEPVEPEGADASALAETRALYIREADPLGSVPPPPTIKGKARSAAKMLKGDRPQAFIDKLGERLAYERGGTRLYDAVIAKFIAYKDDLPEVQLQQVVQIREEEASHAALIRACIEQLGGDPTVQTPSADFIGVAAAGFLQAASDPRTTLAQTLEVALAAELVDTAAWEMLIEMAEKMGQDAMAERFRAALEHENEHLEKVRAWHASLALDIGKLM